jgi:hypothetical protein
LADLSQREKDVCRILLQAYKFKDDQLARLTLIDLLLRWEPVKQLNDIVTEIATSNDGEFLERDFRMDSFVKLENRSQIIKEVFKPELKIQEREYSNQKESHYTDILIEKA